MAQTDGIVGSGGYTYRVVVDWAKLCERSRRDLILALRNHGPQRKQSRPGAGTWRCSRSARTAACAAKLRPISAGRPRGGQSRSGSPKSSFRERSGASPAGLAHLKLPTAGKPEFE